MSFFHNSRGVLYSFMALVLAVSLFAVFDSLSAQRSIARENDAFSFSFGSADSRFSNIYSDFAVLDKEPAARLVEQRNLPFSYSLDYNSVSVTQRLPLSEGVWNSYFDLLNAYSIFLQDTNYSIFYDGTEVSASAPRNAVWGGSASDINFALSPQCLRYSVSSSLSKAGFFPSGSCSFSPSSVSAYGASVVLRQASLEDYNSITYGIQGFSNPSNPSFEFHFYDTNCSKCVLSSNKDIQGYFDPEALNWVSVRCVGSSCSSQDINVYFGRGIYAVHSGSKVDVNFSVGFGSFMELFYLEGFNVRLKSPDFNITVSNS